MCLSDRQIRAEVKIEPFDPGTRKPGTISSGLSSMGYDMRLGFKFKVFSPINASVIDPKNFDPKCLVDIDLTPLPSRDGAHVWNSRGPDGQRVPWHCKRCNFIPPEPYSAVVHDDYRNNPCGALNSPNFLLIPAHSFALAESLERFEVPRDTLGIVLGKSTYARTGLIVNCTPMEPEWCGVLTIELSNTTPLPIKVYVGEGIAQVLFIRSDEKRATLVEDYLKCHGAFDRAQLEKLLKAASCETSYSDRKGKYNHQKGLTLPIAQPESPPANDIGRLE